ncbi:transposase DNA-binding-containing protein [Thiothrix fructosivorans]|uniref:Transposase Tn5-like N-terminal domain-containing protein n=1 Tax=Thiothrix fructosivorans TaxID=111770 RepID=A0ABS3ILG7_9GAMM|nr:hypothetical protein [Thiothrix fructosivorans]
MIWETSARNTRCPYSQRYAESPQSSIPRACQSWSSTLATYRFFWNEGN